MLLFTVTCGGLLRVLSMLTARCVPPSLSPPPSAGKMSQHLDSLGLGDTIDIKGPIGHFTYFGNGRIQIHKEERIVKEIGFICGGTGITPAYQVMKKALRDPSDTTKFFLVYANQTPADILLRGDLDSWAKEFPDRVKIWYTVDRCVWLPKGPWVASAWGKIVWAVMASPLSLTH